MKSSQTAALTLCFSAALLLVAACGGSDQDAAATTTSPVTTAVEATSTAPPDASTSAPDQQVSTTAPAVSTVPESIPPGDTIPEPAGEELPAGDLVVILTEVGEPEFVEGEAQVPITFDVVQIASGQDPVNEDPQLRTVLVIPDADITILGCDGGCDEPETADIDAVRERTGRLFRVSAFGTGDGARITAIHEYFRP